MAFSQAALSMSCRARILGQPGEYQLEIDALRTILAEEMAPNGNADHLLSTAQTTFAHDRGIEDSIVFTKNKSDHWRSTAILHQGAETPQGDLRWFIALAGPEISHYLGYRVSLKNPSFVELTVPKVKKLTEKVLALNKVLIALHYEPIAFMPESTGFVTARQIVFGSIKSSPELPDTLLRFPFADHDMELVPHEVGFHLHMLMSKKIFVERARMINFRLSKLVEVLEKSPEFTELTKTLIKGRSVEMDNGSAYPGFTTAEMRINSGMKNYSELHQVLKLPEFLKDSGIIEQGLNFLAKMGLSPYEAVLQDVSLLTGVGVDLVKNYKGLNTNYSIVGLSNENGQYGIKLTPEQNQKLHSILKQFANDSKDDLLNFPPQPKSATAEAVFKSYEQRQKEIEHAIRVLNSQNP